MAQQEIIFLKIGLCCKLRSKTNLDKFFDSPRVFLVFFGSSFWIFDLFIIEPKIVLKSKNTKNCKFFTSAHRSRSDQSMHITFKFKIQFERVTGNL